MPHPLLESAAAVLVVRLILAGAVLALVAALLRRR
jgi:hypothetical protein